MKEASDAEADRFYAAVPAFRSFADIIDPAVYRPLPDDWLIGLSDVTQSTAAIASGGYKTVNTAGAAVIAAVGNALGGRVFPFVFGGDGASFAVPARDGAAAREALAQTAAWVRAELGLTLRAAMVPVSAVRAQGLDVRIARFAPSPDVAYAMFSGGGLAWAEAELKRGGYAVPPAEGLGRPDLTGLSCRWQEMPAARGVMLSLIVAPGADQAAFLELVEAILALVAGSPQAGRPVPDQGPGFRWPPAGLDLEARATRRQGESLLLRRLRLFVETLLAGAIFRFGLKVGGFDPAVYRRQLVGNSDFRKFDDGLRMTLDCTPELADRIEALLAAAKEKGAARYGLHRQAAAIMTCIVPSPLLSDHVHFVDGASGGYATAAEQLKKQLAEPD